MAFVRQATRGRHKSRLAKALEDRECDDGASSHDELAEALEAISDIEDDPLDIDADGEKAADQDSRIC